MARNFVKSMIVATFLITSLSAALSEGAREELPSLFDRSADLNSSPD